MDEEAGIRDGAKRAIDGEWRVFYGGYWIKAYDAPADTLLAKKTLIEALTRRLFNHVEHGLNIPGRRLAEARHAFDAETDLAQAANQGRDAGRRAVQPRRRDLLTKAVELQALGIVIEPDNALMRQCGDHLQEALALGRLVLHRSGDEGIDELWGEPLKAFAFPIEDFYKSRYIKIAADHAGHRPNRRCALRDVRGNSGLRRPRAGRRGVRARGEGEVRDAAHRFRDLRGLGDVRDGGRADAGVSADRVRSARRSTSGCGSRRACELIAAAKALVTHVTRARVPMPKSTRELLDRLALYATAWAPRPGRNGNGPLANLVVGADEPASTTDPAMALSR